MPRELGQEKTAAGTARLSRFFDQTCDAVLRLAKTGAPLRFTWSWPDIDVAARGPAMVIVSRELDGRRHVTLTLDAGAPEPLPPAGRAPGVDLGVKDFAVTSDGERMANPRHLGRPARSLARYQRCRARCRTGAEIGRAHV